MEEFVDWCGQEPFYNWLKAKDLIVAGQVQHTISDVLDIGFVAAIAPIATGQSVAVVAHLVKAGVKHEEPMPSGIYFEP